MLLNVTLYSVFIFCSYYFRSYTEADRDDSEEGTGSVLTVRWGFTTRRQQWYANADDLTSFMCNCPVRSPAQRDLERHVKGNDMFHLFFDERFHFNDLIFLDFEDQFIMD